MGYHESNLEIVRPPPYTSAPLVSKRKKSFVYFTINCRNLVQGNIDWKLSWKTKENQFSLGKPSYKLCIYHICAYGITTTSACYSLITIYQLAA